MAATVHQVITALSHALDMPAEEVLSAPGLQRALVVYSLHQLAGATYGEIASMVERSESGIKQIMGRFRKRLEDEMGEDVLFQAVVDALPVEAPEPPKTRVQTRTPITIPFTADEIEALDKVRGQTPRETWIRKQATADVDWMRGQIDTFAERWEVAERALNAIAAGLLAEEIDRDLLVAFVEEALDVDG